MTTPADPLTLGIVTDAGEFAQAAAALFKLGDTIFSTLNTPQMLALRQSAAIQAELAKMDATLAQAQKTGDLTELNREASG
jgi:hypothetical protein